MSQTKETRMWEVDITPDLTLLKKAGQQNYRIPDAVAELVDNEIDARIPGQKLTIQVIIQMGKDPRIVAEGNGSGMSQETAAKAMKMAYSEKRPEEIGEFGLGMKAACSNLGKSFEILTCTADSHHATRIIYNEDQFLKVGQWKLPLERVDKPFDHGTRVTIIEPKVNLYAGLKDTMLVAFGRIFKHFIHDGGVEILVNGEPVVAEEPKLLDQYTKPFAFEVQGHKVQGWSGLQTRYSQTGGYGFELIRHNRVLLRHEKIGFKPHPRLARLVGEIHLNDFPVTNNKMDFIRDTALWREFEEMFSKITAEIRGIAGRLASKSLDQKDIARIEDVRQEVQQAINSNAFQQTIGRRGIDQMLTDMEHTQDDNEALVAVEKRKRRNGHAAESTTTSDEAERRTRSPKVTHARLRRVKSILAELEIEHSTVSLGEDSPYKTWDIAATNPTVKLAVATNLDHPMYAEFGEDLVLWVKHNMVEAAAEYFCRESGLHEMLLMKSDILKHIGRIKLAEITEAPALT